MGPVARLVLLAATIGCATALLESVPSPRVQIADGLLRGKYVLTRESKKIRAFLGIPYARPPTGNLRFKSAEPAEPWEGERWAVDTPQPCPQPDRRYGDPIGQEDCLYLNIYTPENMAKITEEQLPNDIPGTTTMNDPCPLLPVMVYFHGGGFEFGDIEPFTHEYLLDEGVILVTVQYRLGLMGFLSTGDEVLPGNLGLKDQRLALQWVHENINAFGGCPHRVTLFGEGAGAASVHYHLLFAPSRGTPFRAGISMSGTALSPWAFHSAAAAKHLAQRVADISGCPSTSRGLVDCLRHKPAAELVQILQEYKNSSSGCGEWAQSVPVLGAVVESWMVEDAFVVTNPWEKTVKLPWMLGVTGKEFLYDLTPHLVDRSDRLFEELEESFNTSLPRVLGYDVDSEPNEIAAHVRRFYLKDKPIKRESFAEIVEAISDGSTVYPTFEATRRTNKRSTFLYNFNFLGINTYGATALDGRIGPGHGDDLFMLFPRPLGKNIPRKNRKLDTALSKKMVKMWTNFAIHLQPTTPDLEGLSWIPIASSTSFLNIGQDTLSMQRSFHLNRMNFWKSVNYPNRDNVPSHDEPSRRFNSVVPNSISYIPEENGNSKATKDKQVSQQENIINNVISEPNKALKESYVSPQNGGEEIIQLDNYYPLPYEVVNLIEELANIDLLENSNSNLASIPQPEEYVMWDWIEVRYNMVVTSDSESLKSNDTKDQEEILNIEGDIIINNSTTEIQIIHPLEMIDNITEYHGDDLNLNSSDPLLYFDPLDIWEEIESYVDPQNVTDWDWVEMRYDLVFTSGSSYFVPEELEEDFEAGIAADDQNKFMISPNEHESEGLIQNHTSLSYNYTDDEEYEPPVYNGWDWIEVRYNLVLTTVTESLEANNTLHSNDTSEVLFEDGKVNQYINSIITSPEKVNEKNITLIDTNNLNNSAAQESPDRFVEEDVIDIEVYMMIAFDQLNDTFDDMAKREEFTEEVLNRIIDLKFDPISILDIFEEDEMESYQPPSYIEFDWIETRYNTSSVVHSFGDKHNFFLPDDNIDFDWTELIYSGFFNGGETGNDGKDQPSEKDNEEVIEMINSIAANQFFNTLEGINYKPQESYNDEGFIERHVGIEDSVEGDYYEWENMPRFIPIVEYQTIDFSGENEYDEGLEYYEEYNGGGDRLEVFPLFINLPVVVDPPVVPEYNVNNKQGYAEMYNPYWRLISQLLSATNMANERSFSDNADASSRSAGDSTFGSYKDNGGSEGHRSKDYREPSIHTNEIFKSSSLFDSVGSSGGYEGYNENSFTSEYKPTSTKIRSDSDSYEGYSSEQYSDESVEYYI